MSFFGWVTGTEKRAASAKTRDPYIAEFFGLGGAAGPAVSAEAVASNLAVAMRCMNLRAQTVASAGLHVYRRDRDGGRARADDLPLYALLHSGPNPNLTAFEWREWLVRDLDLSGNHYALIERNARGQVIGIYPQLARDVGVEKLPGGRMRYRIAGAVYLQDEVLHVRGPSRDGALGLSKIAEGRGALGFALAQAETGRSFTEKALRPSGLLSYPAQLGAEALHNVRAALEGGHAGASNAGRFMILDGGVKFDALSFKPADAEFLASRKLSNEDIARIFDCPPTAVGITDRATYSNTEQEGRALVSLCIGPLCARIEAALMRGLLTDAGRRSFYIEHDLSGLLRGDVKSRYEAYRLGREIGALSANDVRRKENDPPIGPEGDVYHMPANWLPLGATPEAQG